MTREKERAEKLTISGWKMSTALSRKGQELLGEPGGNQLAGISSFMGGRGDK